MFDIVRETNSTAHKNTRNSNLIQCDCGILIFFFLFFTVWLSLFRTQIAYRMCVSLKRTVFFFFALLLIKQKHCVCHHRIDITGLVL